MLDRVGLGMAFLSVFEGAVDVGGAVRTGGLVAVSVLCFRIH